MNWGDYKETAKGPYGKIGLLDGKFDKWKDLKSFWETLCYRKTDYIGYFRTWEFYKNEKVKKKL